MKGILMKMTVMVAAWMCSLITFAQTEYQLDSITEIEWSEEARTLDRFEYNPDHTLKHERYEMDEKGRPVRHINRKPMIPEGEFYHEKKKYVWKVVGEIDYRYSEQDKLVLILDSTYATDTEAAKAEITFQAKYDKKGKVLSIDKQEWNGHNQEFVHYAFEYNKKGVPTCRKLYRKANSKKWIHGKLVETGDSIKLAATDSCDNRGNIVMHYDPFAQDTIRYEYDEKNRMTSCYKRKEGVRMEYTYDTQGNPIRAELFDVHEDSQELEPTRVITVYYNKSYLVNEVYGLKGDYIDNPTHDYSIWEDFNHPEVYSHPTPHNAPTRIVIQNIDSDLENSTEDEAESIVSDIRFHYSKN